MALETGQFSHTLEQIDDSVDQVDAAKGSYASLAAALAAKQDELNFDIKPVENSQNPVYSGGVYPLQAALALVVDADCMHKNVLQNTAETTTVGNEVTFTVNADGSVTATTIATVTTNRYLSWISAVPAGVWWFSTSQPQSGTSPAPCFAAINKSGTQRANDFNNQTLTVEEATNFQFQICIRTGVSSGQSFTFYPMLCHPEWYAISNKYVPYQST